MQSSSLNVLCTDGAVHVTFSPALTPEQYAELLEMVRGDCTIADLRARLQNVSQIWQVQAVLEHC